MRVCSLVLVLALVWACLFLSSPAAAVDSSAPNMVGGMHAIDLSNANDPETAHALEWSQKVLDQINMRSNSRIPFVLERVVSAESQVVNGIRYVFTLELSLHGRRETQTWSVWVLPNQEIGDIQREDRA